MHRPESKFLQDTRRRQRTSFHLGQCRESLQTAYLFLTRYQNFKEYPTDSGYLDALNSFRSWIVRDVVTGDLHRGIHHSIRPEHQLLATCIQSKSYS